MEVILNRFSIHSLQTAEFSFSEKYDIFNTLSGLDRFYYNYSEYFPV
jgi:hypothetical protein